MTLQGSAGVVTAGLFVVSTRCWFLQKDYGFCEPEPLPKRRVGEEDSLALRGAIRKRKNCPWRAARQAFSEKRKTQEIVTNNADRNGLQIARAPLEEDEGDDEEGEP